MYAGRGQSANLALFYGVNDDSDAPGQSLKQWTPGQWPVAPDWQPVIQPFLDSVSGRELGRFLEQRMADGATIYPPKPFLALELTPLDRVRVVILGQDPYHGPGQAQGLAFSVAKDVRLPPSLRNIHKEIARDKAARSDASYGLGQATPTDGSLVSWARQGVLLLNTCLTVEKDLPASHAKRGWEVLTHEIIKRVWLNPRPVVFMLWGAHAQALLPVLSSKAAAGPLHHLVLTANHPSPLSALRAPKPFIGCGHFGLANDFLRSHNGEAIDW
jgi:uracil-DNA glycosylase